MAWDAKGENRKSLADLDQALRLRPDWVEALMDRGLSKVKMGERQSGKADFDRAIDLDPHYTQALTLRAQLLQERGQHEAAISDYRQACNWGNTNTPTEIAQKLVACGIVQIDARSEPHVERFGSPDNR